MVENYIEGKKMKTLLERVRSEATKGRNNIETIDGHSSAQRDIGTNDLLVH